MNILKSLLAFLVLNLGLHAQSGSTSVMKTTDSAAALTFPFNVPSGMTLHVRSGATLTIDAGATFNGSGISIPFSSVTATPTTLGGYGITDGVNAVTNGTNVTGSITGHTLTLGFTGALAVANGGTGQTTLTGLFNLISPMTTLGDTIYGGASGAGTRLAGNTTATKKFLTQTGDGTNSAAPGWNTIVAGDIPALSYVTSVALTMPGIFTLSGSPITSSGTLAVSLATQTANTVWAGPTTGSAATPAFRALVAGDIPTISLSTGVSGTLQAAQMPILTGDATTAGSSLTTSVVSVHGVTYGATPSTNTVPVVTSSNTVTYEAVPNAALANSAITIAGASTALGGSITASAILDSIGSAQGSVLYRNSSAWSALTPGTAGFALLSGGAGVNPSYAAINLSTSAVSNILGSSNGGTGIAFFAVAGPATSTKTFTFPNASATVLTDAALVTVAQGGTGAGTITGLVKGNGTSAFTAATPGTDYQTPLTFSTGLTNSVGSITVNVSQNISTLSNLTSNGFVKTSGGTGTLSVDTTTYFATSATIPIANGGTNANTAITGFNNLSPMTTLGDIIYGGSSGAGTRLAGSTNGGIAVLTQTGNGTISATPAWVVATGTGSPVFSASPTFTGTVLASSITAGTIGVTTLNISALNTSSVTSIASNDLILATAMGGTAIDISTSGGFCTFTGGAQFGGNLSMVSSASASNFTNSTSNTTGISDIRVRNDGGSGSQAGIDLAAYGSTTPSTIFGANRTNAVGCYSNNNSTSVAVFGSLNNCHVIIGTGGVSAIDIDTSQVVNFTGVSLTTGTISSSGHNFPMKINGGSVVVLCQ